MYAVIKTIKKVEFPTGETISFYRYTILNTEEYDLNGLKDNEIVLAIFRNQKEAETYSNKKKDEQQRLNSLIKRYKSMMSVYHACCKMVEERRGYF